MTTEMHLDVTDLADGLLEMTEEQQLAMTTSVMMGFRAVMGAQLAIATVDYDARCHAAEADFAYEEGSGTHLIHVRLP